MIVHRIADRLPRWIVLVTLFFLAGGGILVMLDPHEPPEQKPTAREPPLGTGTRRIVSEYVGCKSRSVFDKSMSIAATGDKEAWKALVSGAMRTGECRLWTVGDVVFVEGTSWSGSSCYRLQGDVDCYWTPWEATK